MTSVSSDSNSCYSRLVVHSSATSSAVNGAPMEYSMLQSGDVNTGCRLPTRYLNDYLAQKAWLRVCKPLEKLNTRSSKKPPFLYDIVGKFTPVQSYGDKENELLSLNWMLKPPLTSAERITVSHQDGKLTVIVRDKEEMELLLVAFRMTRAPFLHPHGAPRASKDPHLCMQLHDWDLRLH